MSSLTNSNDYQRGWNDGHRAALMGKDKDYSRMGVSIKFVIHGSKALDTYTKGYNDGYESGIKEKNVIHKVQIINNDTTMSNQQTGQNFLREIEGLKNLNDFLAILCDRIMQVKSQYQGYMQVMRDTGIPVQQCDVFENTYFAVDSQNFKLLFERIVNFDLPQIKKYIEQIAGQFQQATGQSIGNINLRKPNMSTSIIQPRQAVTRTGGTQDLEKQADAGCDLMDFLVAQRDELSRSNDEYKRYCTEMLDTGVPKQMFNHYVTNYATPNMQHINKTALNMQDKNYPYLKSVFQTIVKTISSLGGNYSRNPQNM